MEIRKACLGRYRKQFTKLISRIFNIIIIIDQKFFYKCDKENIKKN